MTEERAQKMKSVLTRRQVDLTIIFENVWDPHNISAVIRSADAVGIEEVYIIYTQNRKSTKLGRRSSSSAKKWIDVNYYYDVKECFEAVRKKYDKIYCTHMNEDAKSLYNLDLTQKVALVFGNESEGVSKEALSLCDGNFLIPMMGMVQSLNISVACAVSVYEAMRQRSNKGLYNESRMEKNKFEEKLKDWMMK
jgi:tRNA (guanosine-2'-O-)-methyltransferase